MFTHPMKAFPDAVSGNVPNAVWGRGVSPGFQEGAHSDVKRIPVGSSTVEHAPDLNICVGPPNLRLLSPPREQHTEDNHLRVLNDTNQCHRKPALVTNSRCVSFAHKDTNDAQGRLRRGYSDRTQLSTSGVQITWAASHPAKRNNDTDISWSA